MKRSMGLAQPSSRGESVTKGFRYPIFHLVMLVCLGSSVCSTHNAFGQVAQALSETEPLRMEGDLSFELLDRVDAFFMKKTADSVKNRDTLWSRDFSSLDAYTLSIQPNRERFRRYTGVVDSRQAFSDLGLVASLEMPALVAESSLFRVWAVTWPVFEGVEAEGLLFEPRGEPIAQVVVVPDADWSPETVSGIGVSENSSVPALHLALAGCRVLVPTIIDRKNTWSGNPRVRMTNQTHREFIYRQAYFLGRHIIGYEVQKILAAVDYFVRQESVDTRREMPIGVAGYGEGGLLALYSAAVDQRIDAALVSGYFREREDVWKEPVYRNVWGLLHEFGDAGIASLIAPRALIVEASEGPVVEGPPPPRGGRSDAASGSLVSPPLESVKTEFDKAQSFFSRLNIPEKIELVVSDLGVGAPFTLEALNSFLRHLAEIEIGFSPAELLDDRRDDFESSDRMRRQFKQLVDYTQELMEKSVFRREEFWEKADISSIDQWEKSTQFYRDYFKDEIIGSLPQPEETLEPRSRIIYETDNWTGYEVVLNTWSQVYSYGILLVPDDLKPGERRPVVVAQHGRAGRPQDVCNPHEDTRAYHSFGARLADRGFVVYAPQNLYLGEERYRELQRKANPLKLTIFSVMVGQHRQVLNWLGTLPFVDPSRIGFYGLSYGGKSAMIIPSMLEGYALSICSGDFNEEVWKHVSIDVGYSFMLTKEHEHTEFDFGEKFNYAELAGLIAPRPFMVERGHDDGVGEDEWVAFEYAKVRRLYTKLGIGNRTRIEFFDGPHEIHGVGTFKFLHEFLDFPER